MPPAATVRPVVPQLTLEVEGAYYGGQYWTQATYEVCLDVTGELRDVSVTLSLHTSDGHVVDTQVLDHGQAQRAAQTCLRPLQTPPVIGLSGLRHETTWTLGADMADEVVLRGAQLEQIGTWLTFATGTAHWDYDTDGDAWEF